MENVVKLISENRLSIYEDFFNCKNKNEALGLYIWNQKLVGEFTYIIQIIEVSLRNSICNAHVECKGEGDDWFVKYFNAQPSNDEGKKQLTYVLTKLSRKVNSYNNNDIISRLPFGFWSAICSEQHNESNANSLRIWPALLPNVFKGIDDENGDSQAYIFSLVSNVNKIRNRIFHHEVIWKDISGLGLTPIFNKVFESYKDCLELARLIGLDNLRIIKIVDGISSIKNLCSVETVESFKRIADDFAQVDFIKKDYFKDEIKTLEVNGNITSVNPNNIYIKSMEIKGKDDRPVKFKIDNNEKAMFTNAKVGDLVNFTPFVVRRNNGNIYIAKDAKLA